MTTEQFIAKLDRQLKGAIKAFDIAVASTHALQVQRIFVEGKGSTGTIGQYNSTKPIYVNPSKAPRKFPPKGKFGKSKFKNGKPHQTGYFSSYKAFRGKQGRETGFVNLRLHGTLQSDFRASLTKQGGFLVSGVRNKANARKLAGIRKKYGERVFRLSLNERQNLVKVAEFETKKAFQ